MDFACCEADEGGEGEGHLSYFLGELGVVFGVGGGHDYCVRGWDEGWLWSIWLGGCSVVWRDVLFLGSVSCSIQDLWLMNGKDEQ